MLRHCDNANHHVFNRLTVLSIGLVQTVFALRKQWITMTFEDQMCRFEAYRVAPFLTPRWNVEERPRACGLFE